MRKKLTSLFSVLAMLAAFLPAIPVNAAASINIGDYVAMGTYYGEMILWRCVDIDDNGPLMLSDKIICLKPFDAAGSDISGSHAKASDRLKNGSNYWQDSNLRSWLNSNESAGNIVWACGNSPKASEIYDGYNAYDDEAGFLTNFFQEELDSIKEVEQKSLLSVYDKQYDTYSAKTYHEFASKISNVVKNYDSCYAEDVSDKMFCLDVKQVSEVYNNRSTLGDAYYIGQPTEQCVANSEFSADSLKSETNWQYWLRTPYGAYVSYNVRYVTSSGKVNNGDAHVSSIGVRPAFYLDLSAASFVSGTGTSEDPYVMRNKYTASIKNGYFEKDADGKYVTSKDIYENTEVEIKTDISEEDNFAGWVSDADEDIFEDSQSMTTKITMPSHDVNITAKEYLTATVTNGHFVNDDNSTSMKLCEGDTAEITAQMPDGYKFAGWTSDAGDSIFDDPKSETTKITMPSKDVTITAKTKKLVTVTIENGHFVSDGKSEGVLGEGDYVEIEADSPEEGYKFVGWTSDATENIFDDRSSTTTKIIVPANDVTITAQVKPGSSLSLTIDSDKTVNVGVSNLDGGVLAVAVYDGENTLRDMRIKDFANKSYDEIEVMFSGLDLENGYTVKAMLWNGLNAMCPLTRAVSDKYQTE